MSIEHANVKSAYQEPAIPLHLGRIIIVLEVLQIGSQLMKRDKLVTCIPGPLLSFGAKLVLALVIARLNIFVLGVEFPEKTGPSVLMIVVPIFIVMILVLLVLVLIEEPRARILNHAPP